MKETVGVISAPENTYALWKGEKTDFWIARVWAFEYNSEILTNGGQYSQIIPISGNFAEGYEDTNCSQQITFIGTKEECEKELQRKTTEKPKKEPNIKATRRHSL